MIESVTSTCQCFGYSYNNLNKLDLSLAEELINI